jgi:predicted alpha/beta-hydrolase family hydrolase
MRHPFIESITDRLAERDIATLRYQFPYMERGNRRPDPPGILVATVSAAVKRAAEEDLPLFAGGKSLGGRMSSTAASEPTASAIDGLVFFGFPLHAPGKPSSDRAAHLEHVRVPMLFLQGTRDSLADLDFLRPVIDRLGRLASLHVVEGADHSFRVPKRSGRSETEIIDELAEVTVAWMDRVNATVPPAR